MCEPLAENFSKHFSILKSKIIKCHFIYFNIKNTDGQSYIVNQHLISLKLTKYLNNKTAIKASQILLQIQLKILLLQSPQKY